MSNDIIVLEEILGYVLEALDVIEVNFPALYRVTIVVSLRRNHLIPSPLKFEAFALMCVRQRRRLRRGYHMQITWLTTFPCYDHPFGECVFSTFFNRLVHSRFPRSHQSKLDDRSTSDLRLPVCGRSSCADLLT